MESWKPVEGYVGYYEVSDLGNVRSVDRICKYVRNGGIVNHLEKGKLLSVNKSGRYYRVTLAKDGRMKYYSVHRLVAIAFIPNPLNLPVVNHKFGNKKDNNYTSLEWSTNKDNTIHAFNTGLINKDKLGKHRINVPPKNSKKVVNILTGEVYRSSMEAARQNGFKVNSLRSYLNGAIKTNTTNLVYLKETPA